MDTALAHLIAEAGGALRARLDDITLAALSGDDARGLVAEARELADAITSAVFLLDESADAEHVRRTAAHLVANLALLENILDVDVRH